MITHLDSVYATNNVDLIQESDGSASFSDDGAGFGTTAKNVTEDGNGPDAAYDNTDVHTNSVFKDSCIRFLSKSFICLSLSSCHPKKMYDLYLLKSAELIPVGET